MSQAYAQVKEFVSNCRPWQIAVLSCTIVLGLLYVWQVNISATRGFTMRDLERDIHALSLDQERYQLEVARLQSIESVTTRVQMLGLTKVDRVDFIEVSEPAVAINN